MLSVRNNDIISLYKDYKAIYSDYKLWCSHVAQWVCYGSVVVLVIAGCVVLKERMLDNKRHDSWIVYRAVRDIISLYSRIIKLLMVHHGGL